MPEKMQDTLPREYRIVVRPSSAVRRQEARRMMQRESNSLVLAATKDGFSGDQYFHWLGDLRRGQLRIWGGMLRFIDVSILRRVPKAILKLMPKFLDSYIEETYPDDGGDPPAARAA